MLALKLLCLALSFAGGLVVHHWLARRWFGALETVEEREVLLHGLLASIVVNGAAATYLALAHLFYPAAFAALFTACMLLLPKDARATFWAARESLAALVRDIGQLRLIPLAATCGWLLLALSLVATSRIPTANVDAWAFQLPLAFSIIEHHGFIYPQIGNTFYANQPLFVNVLFAQAMSVEPNFVAAGLMNILIYLFMFLSLAAAWKSRALALCLLLVAIGTNQFFSSGVPMPLTDMPRSCFSVLGLTYVALYLDRRVPYYAGLAALCIGAAVASKFTELLSLGLLGLALIPALAQRAGRVLVAKCAAVVAVIASYWYLKNLVLLGNPLYPFLFGHPGLSDAWMADYMTEMTRAFDPSLRYLRHDLLSVGGWRDFMGVTWSWFFGGRRIALLSLLLGIVGAIISPRRIAPLLAATAFLFLFWYVVMFNHIRWAIPADMLLFVTGCYAFLALLEKFDPLRRLPMGWQAWLLSRKTAAIAAGVFIASAGLMFLRHSPSTLSNTIVQRLNLEPIIEPMFYALRPGGIDEYLASTREGYALYHYVTLNNLHGVLQPYDNGVKLYAAAYNGGLPGDWFIDIHQIPTALDDGKEYIATNHIAYFIARSDLKPVEIERLGPAKLDVASKVIGMLKPGARLLLEDANGWRLYQAGPAGAKSDTPSNSNPAQAVRQQ